MTRILRFWERTVFDANQYIFFLYFFFCIEHYCEAKMTSFWADFTFHLCPNMCIYIYTYKSTVWGILLITDSFTSTQVWCIPWAWYHLPTGNTEQMGEWMWMKFRAFACGREVVSILTEAHLNRFLLWLRYRGITGLARTKKTEEISGISTCPFWTAVQHQSPNTCFLFCAFIEVTRWDPALRLFCGNSLYGNRTLNISLKFKPSYLDLWCSKKAI